MSNEKEKRTSEDVDMDQVQGMLRAVQKSLGGAQDKYNLLEVKYKKQETELQETSEENAKLKKKLQKLQSEEKGAEKAAPFRPSRIIAASKEEEGVGWIEDIFLKNQPKPSPKLIKGKCKSSFAYCILVMDRDSYALGAAVLAHRLKKLKTKADTVCMVTKDVSVGAVDTLASVFDVVFQVPYLEYTCRKMATKKQQSYYGHWIERSFTKWNALALTMYNKVLFMDADILPVVNVDHLFEMKAPAATFSSPWASTYREIGYEDPYKGLNHGDIVPNSMIREAIKLSIESSRRSDKIDVKGSYVGLGSLVLLQPSLEAFAIFNTFVRSQLPFGIPGCHSGFDEQSIVLFYYLQSPIAHWTHISQEYNALAWHESWLDGFKIKCFHYLNDKPWKLRPDVYSDLQHWYKATDEFAVENSQANYLLEVCLKDVTFLDIYRKLRNGKDLKSEKPELFMDVRSEGSREESLDEESPVIGRTKPMAQRFRAPASIASSSETVDPPKNSATSDTGSEKRVYVKNGDDPHHSHNHNHHYHHISQSRTTQKKPVWFDEFDERRMCRTSVASSVRSSSPYHGLDDCTAFREPRACTKSYSQRHLPSAGSPHVTDRASYHRHNDYLTGLGRKSYGHLPSGRNLTDRWTTDHSIKPYVEPALKELRRQQVLSSSPANRTIHQRLESSFGSSTSGGSVGRLAGKSNRTYHNI